jgi:hypothetical protein
LVLWAPLVTACRTSSTGPFGRLVDEGLLADVRLAAAARVFEPEPLRDFDVDAERFGAGERFADVERVGAAERFAAGREVLAVRGFVWAMGRPPRCFSHSRTRRV